LSSSFKSKNLFGSGPHRFMMSKRGQLVVSSFALGGGDAGSVWLGLVETDITVRGRLQATTEAALWVLRDAVLEELIDPPAAGTLVDLNERSWSTMSFVSYVEGDRTDRGRVRSVAYTAIFRKFNTPP